jgi:RES domain-containing protein
VVLQTLLSPWVGEAFRHIPTGPNIDVLDFRYAGRHANNRWNTKGQPTVYLAGDEGVLIAEWGRHFDVSRPAGLEREAVVRSVYRLSIALDSVLDLRSAEVWQALSLQNAPHCFLDFSIARAAAHYIRATTEAQAIFVPSAGFLDQLDRWCLVLFLEKLADTSSFIKGVVNAGQLRMD